MIEFQAEVCHILFAISVDYTEYAEIASTPPSGYTELPTCPVCLGEPLANSSELFYSSVHFPCWMCLFINVFKIHDLILVEYLSCYL